MARIARVVAPGVPHQVTQRGVSRMEVFFSEADYGAYLDLLRRFSVEHGLAVWGYCLMPNHVHLVAVPEESDSLVQAVARTHWHYTRMVNFRERWRGYLWQGRFGSCPLDEGHALAALRHVELNPVRAGLSARPEDWPFSSARAHLGGVGHSVLTAGPMIPSAQVWRAFLAAGQAEDEARAVRRHTRTGRPLGTPVFVAGLEAVLSRSLHRQKPGPKPKEPR